MEERMMKIRSLVSRSLAAATMVSIAGCVVGPDFKKPAAPQLSGYTPSPLAATATTPNVTGGDAQRFLAGRDIPAEWWSLFHSKPLNALIEQALKNNPDLKAAQAALSVARENVLAQQGAYYPTVTAGLSASRQKTSGELAPTPNANILYFNLYTPQVSVSYMPDVFGLNRRTVESLNAQAEQTRFALIATQITLTSNIVAAAIEEASLRAQIDATEALIADNRTMLHVLRNQYARGYADRLDVAAQESQLAQAAATLPPLLKQLDQQRHLLIDLVGSYPDKDLSETFELSSLQLPGELPVSLPSKLVDQRPDILQAEENLHSASAQIGIAVANRLPNITLSAAAGAQALTVGQLFSDDASIWSLGASLSQTVFDGGTLMHRERAARAAYDQAREQYRSTVLVAFQNVADTLSALSRDADALEKDAAAAAAAKVTLDLTRKQALAGETNNLALFTAEIAFQQAEINLVQAEASRYADTAALFQALGGGWWNGAEAIAEKE
jgi:NodT family efflux transporter outer membrane factor (OMF) lipoprotein